LAKALANAGFEVTSYDNAARPARRQREAAGRLDLIQLPCWRWTASSCAGDLASSNRSESDAPLTGFVAVGAKSWTGCAGKNAHPSDLKDLVNEVNRNVGGLKIFWNAYANHESIDFKISPIF